MERTNQSYQNAPSYYGPDLVTVCQLQTSCWFLPAGSYHPRHTNTSDLGSVADVQISSGSSVCIAVKLGVVFGTRQAQFSKLFLLQYQHGSFQCFATGGMAQCVRVFLVGFLLEASTGLHTSPAFLGKLQRQRKTSVGCLAVTFPPLQEVSCQTSVCSCQPPGRIG